VADERVRVKSTTFTDPAGPLGESLGSVATWSIRESGKMEICAA